MKALGFLLSEIGWEERRGGGGGEGHRRVTYSNLWFKRNPLALCWEWMQDDAFNAKCTFLVKDIQRKVEKIVLTFRFPIQYLKIFQSSSECYQFITYFSRAQKVPAIQSPDFINNNENNNSQRFWEDPLGSRICDMFLASIWSSWKAVIYRYYSQLLNKGKMKVRKG